MLDLLRGVREYVYPIGRLDFDSEGLAAPDQRRRPRRPAHASAARRRTGDEARVLGVPDARDLERLARGVMIDGPPERSGGGRAPAGRTARR